jgi:hypothetical protein
MEINLYTCEFVGEGTNITAIIKCQGKPIAKFNCRTKYINTAMKAVEDVMSNISFYEAIKLSDHDPEDANEKVGEQ